MILNKENKEAIIERLNIARRNKGFKYKDIARIWGISEGGAKSSFYQKSINEHKINLLVKELSINEHWLVTGSEDCDMFWGDTINSNIVNEPSSLYGTGAKKEKEGTPFYDVEFRAGFDLVIGDQTINPEYMIYSPIYRDCDAVVPAFGDSMVPVIYSGDKIGIKQTTVAEILYGEIYAIITDEWRTIKYVRKSKDDTKIILIPENLKDYDEQELDKSKVLSIFLIRAFERRRC